MKFFATIHAISFFSLALAPSIPEIFESPPTYSKRRVMHTPKIVMAAISSKLEAAINVVGIPFLVP